MQLRNVNIILAVGLFWCMSSSVAELDVLLPDPLADTEVKPLSGEALLPNPLADNKVKKASSIADLPNPLADTEVKALSGETLLPKPLTNIKVTKASRQRQSIAALPDPLADIEVKRLSGEALLPNPLANNKAKKASSVADLPDPLADIEVKPLSGEALLPNPFTDNKVKKASSTAALPDPLADIEVKKANALSGVASLPNPLADIEVKKANILSGEALSSSNNATQPKRSQKSTPGFPNKKLVKNSLKPMSKAASSGKRKASEAPLNNGFDDEWTDENETDFLGLVYQYLGGGDDEQTSTPSSLEQTKTHLRNSLSNSVGHSTTPKSVIKSSTIGIAGNKMTETTTKPTTSLSSTTTTAIPSFAATISNSESDRNERKNSFTVDKDAKSSNENKTNSNSVRTMSSMGELEDQIVENRGYGPQKGNSVEKSSEEKSSLKMIVSKGDTVQPLLLKFSENETKHTLEVTLKKDPNNGADVLLLEKKDSDESDDDDTDTDDEQSDDDQTDEPKEDEEDETEGQSSKGKSSNGESSDNESEDKSTDDEESENTDDSESEDNEVEDEWNPWTLSASHKDSQAGIYTPNMDDVPKADARNLQDLLRKYFLKPRHWSYNQSNTWHIKLLKEFKSYGLKTFVQENNDQDRFWFYNEHKRDTELVKYPIVNVVGILPGKFRGQQNDGILIVGAHYDTLSDSPGVDDNGSGMAVLMETARVLAKSKYTMENTIFFVAFDRREQGFGGSGLFVLEHLIPAELLVKRGYLQGAFIIDTVMNYDPRPRSQSIPKSVKKYCPEATKAILKHENRGDFLSVVSRRHYDDHLVRTFVDNWKRLNDTKYKIMEMTVNGTGDIERDDIFYKGYYFFASDHIYFWYPESEEFNGTLPAVRLFDTGIERGRMRKCHHRSCDNSSLITEDNLLFLKKTTDALILTLVDLGKGSPMVQLSADENKKIPWNYFMYMGSAILSGTAFLATTISKLDSV